VDRGPLRVTLTVEGRTRMRDRASVLSPVSGRLDRVLVEAGGRVGAGQPIAQVRAGEAGPLDARTLEEARGRLAAAQARLAQVMAHEADAAAVAAQAMRERGRLTALLAAGAIAPRDAEQGDRAAESAALALAAVREAVRAARAERDGAAAVVATRGSLPRAGAGDMVVVRAPFDGVVLRLATRGDVVVAAGAPIAEVGAPTSLEVRAELLTTDAARVPVGAAAEVFGWVTGGEGATARLPARVLRVEPGGYTKVSALGIEEQRTDVVLALEPGGGARPRVAPAPDAVPATVPPLGDSYRVEVEILLAERTDVVRVPLAALVRDAAGWSVFVVDGGRARRRAVTPGERGGGVVAITQGLAPGEVVVAYPGDEVRDGSRVRNPD
jgi:HlyD family secretion protein